jgi:hypothetical protein
MTFFSNHLLLPYLNPPTKALKSITPKEAWTKIKTDVRHFRVFGSIAWAHILDEKRKAL